MKLRNIALILWAVLLLICLAACGAEQAATDDAADSAAEIDTSQVAGSEDMTTVDDVVEEGMVPIYAESLNDGFYEVTVDSSSSMFSIVECALQVADGVMIATMKMGGTGYLYVYPGTPEEAAAAPAEDLISFVENSDGSHSFTIPVEALDAGIKCAAFSKNKEQWYDRTLVFRSDSLPFEAWASGAIATVDSLGLEEGSYYMAVTLSGGSGRASVESPAVIDVSDGKAFATIIWSSPNYDYMIVDGEKYLPVNTEGNSAFRIPVSGFDYRMAVIADTTAMSEPHEIDYTLNFDSSTIEGTTCSTDADSTCN